MLEHSAILALVPNKVTSDAMSLFREKTHNYHYSIVDHSHTDAYEWGIGVADIVSKSLATNAAGRYLPINGDVKCL